MPLPAYLRWQQLPRQQPTPPRQQWQWGLAAQALALPHQQLVAPGPGAHSNGLRQLVWPELHRLSRAKQLLQQGGWWLQGRRAAAMAAGVAAMAQ